MADEDVAAINGEGQRVRPLIGQETKLAWPHGFDVTQYDLAPGFETDLASFAGRDVVYVYQGSVAANIEGTHHTLGPGDTATIDVGAMRQFKNTGKTNAVFLRVQTEINA